MKLIRKQLYFKANNFDDEEYTLSGIFSTGTEDRQGDVIVQTGWKLDQYLQNPVVLFAHDHYQPAIGQMISIGINTDGNLEGMIKFAAKEYDFAETIYNLYKGGFMRAFSVGFQNLTYEVDQENDRMILKENVLYEVSAVNIPANAMALAMSKGIDMGPIENLYKSIKDKKKDNGGANQDHTVAIQTIKQSNKETIRAAIKALTEALKSDPEADNQVDKNGRIPLNKGGKKQISVSILNRAIRELLKIKKSQ